MKINVRQAENVLKLEQSAPISDCFACVNLANVALDSLNLLRSVLTHTRDQQCFVSGTFFMQVIISITTKSVNFPWIVLKCSEMAPHYLQVTSQSVEGNTQHVLSLDPKKKVNQEQMLIFYTAVHLRVSLSGAGNQFYGI